jgi:uncharacterized protein YjbI with pentapeptide repeats
MNKIRDRNRNIKGINFTYKTLKNELKEAEGGILPFPHLCLSLLWQFIGFASAVIPVVSGIVFIWVIEGLNGFNNNINFIVFLLFFIGLYSTAIITLIFKGFEITNLALVVLILVGSSLANLILRVQNSSPFIFIGIAIVFAWIGILIQSTLMCINYFLLKRKGLFTLMAGMSAISLLTILFDLRVFPGDLSFVHYATSIASAYFILIIGIFIGRQAIQDLERLKWIREIAIYLTTIWGTSFYGLNLTDVCFDGSHLPHTDFRKTNLTRTSFEGVSGLETSNLKGTLLENKKVRELMVTKIGCNEDYTECNFNGANLRGANLTGATLMRVQALGADFSGATLTDACIEGWNINHETRFHNVLCDRIYLKCTRYRDRTILSDAKPDSGRFKPGEFEKWITEIQDTVDLIFDKGLNWKAFAFSLTQSAIEKQGIDLGRYQVENKGEGVTVVKVGVEADSNKAEIHEKITHHYHEAVGQLEQGHQLWLQAKQEEIDALREILRSQWQEFRELANIFSDSNRQVSIQGEGHRIFVLKEAGEIMENKSEGFSVGGSLSIGGDNMSLTGAQLTLGDLTGQVTNTIQQLKDVKADDGKQLAEILANLQQSISGDVLLDESQQKRALKAVNTLAKEGKKDPKERDLDICAMALDALKGVSTTVSHASKLAEFVEKYLPTLSQLLGI